jgi:hypothetical protein
VQQDFVELGQEYGTRIDKLLQSAGVGDSLARYFNPKRRFAATSFDDIRPNERDSFSEADFLAVGFLDTPIRAFSYRTLVAKQKALEALLRRIPDQKKLWELDQSDWDAANELSNEFRAVDGIGPTRASKLLARKRPHLIPIWDSRVSAFFEWKTKDFWWPLSLALKDDARRERIERIRPPTAPPEIISTIRLLDVAIWMRDESAPGTVTGDED